jgi:hypothetical protein
LACAPSVARAGIPDVFGLGSEESALAGASSARVHDFSAGFYNPGGLALLKSAEVSIGFVGFGSALKIRQPGFERTAEITNPTGVVIGAATPIPFTGVLADRLYLGIALVLPDTTVRVIAHTPDQPFYPLYDNRTQRLVVLPSLAARIGWGLTLGIGLNYLAGLGGRVSASEGSTRAIEARVDESIFSVLGVNAGVRWQATRLLALAIVYRQEFSVPFRTISRNTVAGQPINLDIDAQGLYTPHELVLGGALKLPWRVTGSLDLQWSHWSAYRGPFVTVSSELPLVGAIDTKPPTVAFNDTVGVRGSLEWIAVEKKYSSLTLRAGYAFESAAAPADQPGVTNLLDGHKHRLCAGGGLRFELFGGHIRADLHGSLDIVQSNTITKKVAPAGTKPDPSTALADEIADDPAKPSTLGTQISNPGYPTISGGGVVWALGFTITVETK